MVETLIGPTKDLDPAAAMMHLFVIIVCAAKSGSNFVVSICCPISESFFVKL